MTKEEILRKNVPTITFDKLIGTPIAQVLNAMEDYSNSRVKELKEEIDQLNKDYSQEVKNKRKTMIDFLGWYNGYSQRNDIVEKYVDDYLYQANIRD